MDQFEPERRQDQAATEPAPRQRLHDEQGDERAHPTHSIPASEPESKRPGFTVTDRRFWARGGGDLAAEAERPRLPTYVEQLKSQVEEKDRQLREYIAAYKREVVEGLEKTKQRLERDAAREKERERGEVAKPMMEVLDALERSVEGARASKDVQAVVEGLSRVQQLMVQKLQELGLTRIETSGKPFDPLLHEAAAVVPVSDPSLDRIITAELRPGFMLGQRVVRAALVQVGRLQT